jgi:homoserine dehydrogenase
MFYGRGAGGLPTASAAISDIVCIGKSIANNLGRDLEITSMDWKHKDLNLTKVKDFYTRYYVRFTVPDITGILAKIASVFAKYNISIAAVIQKEKVLKLQKETKEKVVPLVILTHTASENNIQLAIKEIVSNKYSVENPVIIRVEDEE